MTAKIDDSDEKLKKYKDQLYLVSSNKEYDALMLEIDHIKTFLDGVENNILDLEEQKNTLEEKNKSELLSDTEALEILSKMIKQRKDSIDQFETANRLELAEKEKKEIEIIQNYLPKQLSEEELSILIKEVIKEVNAESVKDMGKVMGTLKPKIIGKADAGKASSLVKKLLS